MVRPVARTLHYACMAGDIHKLSPAAIVDFGLQSTEHFYNLSIVVRDHNITPAELDEVLGDGKKIKELVNRFSDAPYPNLDYVTSWDFIEGRK